MVSKVVIPVAGLGTRFLPATIAQPKEMLPIVDKPTIQFVVEEAVSAGLNDIVIITGKNKRALEDHFDPSPELLSLLKIKGKIKLVQEVQKTADLGNFFLIRQKQPLGSGHAVLQAEQHISNQNFAVMLGDTIIDQEKPCIGEIAQIFDRYKLPVIAVEAVDPKRVSQYGVVGIKKKITENLFEISSLIEKPTVDRAPSNLAIAARYILTPAIFDILKKTKPGVGGEIQLTDAMAEYLKNNKMLAYKISGKRWDIGSKAEYAKAFVALGLKHPEIKGELYRFLELLLSAEKSKIY